MRKFCRILGIVVASAVVVAIAFIVVKVARKPKANKVYATNVEFLTLAGGMEMFIGNDLILNYDMVKISPQNCEFDPEFSVKMFGALKETVVENGRYTFTEKGRYTICCKVKSSENNYIDDKITIKVVEEPTETTAMYITKLDFDGLRADKTIELNKIVNISSIDKVSKIECTEHITYNEGIITAIKPGEACINIFMTNDNLTIVSRIEFTIVNNVDTGDVKLKLTFEGRVLTDNIVEVEYSTFNFVISYEIEGFEDNQYILCTTNDDVVSIVSSDHFNICEPPFIILKPLRTGETIIYVTPLENTNIEFEIIVRII